MPLINYIGNRQECLDSNRRGRGGAPPAPSMSIDYLIVGGGTSGGNNPGNGGCAGGFLSASAQIAFPSTLTISVGAGATNSSQEGIGSSSISASNFGYYFAGAGTFNQSGYPQNNTVGLSNATTFGGGAGALQNGQDAVPPTAFDLGLNGYGGDGLQWLNGTYYAGGGGATSGNGAAPGVGGLGGGGSNTANGEDGKGGGAGGSGTIGGSGAVIIRYLTNSISASFISAIQGGQVTVTGSYTYHTFTSSAEFTYKY